MKSSVSENLYTLYNTENNPKTAKNDMISPMFEELVKYKKPNREKLLEYGFKETQEGFSLEKEAQQKEFLLTVCVSGKGDIDTALYDLDNECEYVLYKTNAVGEYVGAIRSMVREEVAKVVENCFDDASFRYPQTLRLLSYIKKKYGDELSFLGESHNYAILRNQKSKKWYAFFAAVALNKLGYESKERGEVVTFRCRLDQLQPEYAHLPLLPGYCMNKKSWATIVLDESIDDRPIFELIDQSYTASDY